MVYSKTRNITYLVEHFKPTEIASALLFWKFDTCEWILMSLFEFALRDGHWVAFRGHYPIQYIIIATLL
jgi:hypothetical protein